MKNRYLFEVETAWSFPLMQYTTNTSYVEVRKASGIAYILMELISNPLERNEKIVTTLKNLGVPFDIHYIFADELANMISYGIVQMKSNRVFGVDLFNIYSISDFEITELGKKLFAEGTIPTGNNKVKKLNVYYDLSKKDTKSKFDYKLFRISNSVLDESCVGDIQLNSSDIEMYITDNMSKYSFRKGERIAGFSHEVPDILVYKLDDAVSIRIDDEKMYIAAKDKDRDEFIKKNYSLDTISKIIMAKKKYMFHETLTSEIGTYEYAEMQNVTQINLPSQFNNIMNAHNQLALCLTEKMNKSECQLSREDAKEILHKCDIGSKICFFDKGDLYSIIPGKFLIKVEGYSGKCNVNLILTQQLSKETSNQLLREIFLKCISVEEPMTKADVIKKLTEISKCKDYIEQFAFSELRKQKSIDEKITMFLKLDNQFAKVKEWKTVEINKAEEYFDELCKTVTLDKFVSQNVLGEKLNKIIKMPQLEYLSRISQKIIENDGDIIAYEAMEELNYDIGTVLGVVNVFKKYCQQILDGEIIKGNSKLGSQCALFGQAVSELRELTGITNPLEDLLELDMDNDRFIKVMATASDVLKDLNKYRQYATEQFKQFDVLIQRYIDIKEVVTIERKAFKNPQNINREYIEQQLKKSRYKDAICDLHVRLQYELNRIFGTASRPTFDLLNLKEISQYLTDDEIRDMHSLRICRNGFQHPKVKREVKYSEQIIREWCTIVEKLGGVK